jgi:hypothetical protein
VRNFPAARQLFEEAVELAQRTLGDEDEYTGHAIGLFGTFLADMREFSTARPLLEEALATGVRIQGSEHPATVTAMMGLERLLSNMGEHAAAMELSREVLRISTRLHGEHAAETLLATYNVGAHHLGLGDSAAEKVMKEKAHAGARATLGDSHPTTVYYAAELAKIKARHEWTKQAFEQRRANVQAGTHSYSPGCYTGPTLGMVLDLKVKAELNGCQVEVLGFQTSQPIRVSSARRDNGCLARN